MAKSRRGATAQSGVSKVPGWVWFFSGTVSGLFIAFLAWLAGAVPDPQAVPVAKTKAKPAEQQAAARANTRFDFYTLLPEREIIVPEEQSRPLPEPKDPVSYILQAGSFKRAEDAERRRAELALLGLEARVEAVNANGDTWHRVQVGPFDNRSKLAKARNTLVSNGIDTLLIKKKG